MDHSAPHYCYILRTKNRGAFYIGATNDPDRRYLHHVKVCKNPNTPLKKAVNEVLLSGEKIYMDIVFCGGRIEVFKKERELILDARNQGSQIVNTFRYAECKTPTEKGLINYLYNKTEGAL
jgi:hypothetical protein